jgi:predicted nuclease of predicted toxin-antitoxin system
VKILLDENLPESLLAALERLGHEVDSVNHLKLKGLDNGTLYRQVAKDYELCFTKDAGFAHNVRQMRDPSPVKILRVLFPNNVSSCSFLLLLTLSRNPIGRATPMEPTGPDPN